MTADPTNLSASPNTKMKRDHLARTRSREMVDDSHHQVIDEDPLMISQTLTYVTDDGSVVHSFQSAPLSLGFKARFIILEAVFLVLLICAVPIGAHGTVVAVSLANLLAVAWFWYNYVRNVEVTSDGNLRFWIGNIEIDVPFDKIISMRRMASSGPCTCLMSVMPYRGFFSNPQDGVAVVTTVPSTPFWLWPRSAGKPERTLCCGALMCPKLTIVFSPAGGGHQFIQDVENEMRNFSNGNNKRSSRKSSEGGNGNANPAPDFLDV